MQLYRNESSDPKYNAQRNLEGRTHYVDPDTLKFHKSRILQTAITDGGLLFALVESAAGDYEGKTRVFRPVIFDVFGNVVERPKLEDSYKSRKAAESAMWDILNELDAEKLTLDAIEQAERNHASEMQYLREDLAKLKEKAA